MCDFKVGDEVVCVDSRRSLDPHLAPAAALEKGRIYTVIEVYFRKKTNRVCVRLSEQLNYCRVSKGDIGFNASRFRKVERRNLTEWLSQSVGNTDKLDKKKVRVK